MGHNFCFDDFLSPPDEYGIVSFYWWVGEPLTKKRLIDQLDRLKEMDIAGLQINYCHRDRGGLAYGLPYRSDPPQFSEKWWKLFAWFVDQANLRNMSVSVSDYTFMSAGQGFFIDRILDAHPELNGYLLRCETAEPEPGKPLPFRTGKDTLCLCLLAAEENIRPDNAPHMLAPEEVCPPGKWRAFHVYREHVPNSLDPMHPLSGREMIRVFFSEFERHLKDKCGKGLNYFFSDELSFGISGLLYNDFFLQEFQSRKNYNLLPYLPALFHDIGDITPKIRLDYFDVLVALEEENYFAPVFEWHESHGMVYGCDHGGRGKDVVEFGDYFRTQKYNQGPGNDQPALASDIIKNKVASSISHLYERPRTWLEGFYGSGWGTSSAQLADAVFRNFAMGHNLLSYHGLYYTTLGGFFEWAPPCNHFRMPYWAQMKKLNRAFKRLSYLNTVGVHACDVAILYPTASVQAGDGSDAVNSAFELGSMLYRQGIDFDFMDFESLARATIEGIYLCVAGERYRALVLPDARTVHFSTLKKMSEFSRAGGLCFRLGESPCATDRVGRNDSLLGQLDADAFPSGRTNLEELPAILDTSFPRDFRVSPMPENDDSEHYVHVLHRRTANADFYNLYGVRKGAECTFRATGIPVFYLPMEGRAERVANYLQHDSCTTLSFPYDEKTAVVLCFHRDDTDERINAAPLPSRVIDKIPLEGKWGCRYLPTLDNTFGDFHFPPSNEAIGVQLRKVHADGILQTAGYGPRFKFCGPIAPETDFTALEKLLINEKWKETGCRDYAFSLRYGVEGDPGRQGYHGLKGKVTDDFLVFGRQNQTMLGYEYLEEIPGGSYYFCTHLFPEQAGTYRFRFGRKKPDRILLDGELLTREEVFLSAGKHQVILRFRGAGRSFFVASPLHASLPMRKKLAMRWYGDQELLSFHAEGKSIRCSRIHFFSPPGAKRLTLRTYGDVTTVSTNVRVARQMQTERVYETTLEWKKTSEEPEEVVLDVQSQTGAAGGGVLVDFCNYECNIGSISLGDWAQYEALACYSGGIAYSRTVILSPKQSESICRIDIAEISSSAELWVNGRHVKTLVAPPWNADLTGAFHAGSNELEIRVFNTLYNHYRTIPTRYAYPQSSGMTGPVLLCFFDIDSN